MTKTLKKKPECPFTLPPPDLTRDESVPVQFDDSIVTVPYESNPLDRNTNDSKESLDKNIEWFVLMITLIAYVHFASVNSDKKMRAEMFQESLAVTLYANLHAFCGDEFLHLLACLGTYEHRRPLAYWYRLYTILGEGVRMPLFYYYIQPELNRQMQPFYSQDEWQQNFMALILGFTLLNSISRLHSELINPKYLLSNQQRELFFRWRSTTPDISPAPSPSPKKYDVYDLTAENYMPRQMLSMITEASGESTPPADARAKQEFFMRNGLNYSLQSTPSPASKESTPRNRNTLEIGF